MKWTDEAEAAVRRVPFFVRKRVRTSVEKEATEKGKKRISLTDVKATQARYLKKMGKEVKGYQVDTCFGSGGCPHRIQVGGDLANRIEKLLADAGLREFLKSRVAGDLKFHHEFRVSIANCPNACSQPQIRDVGIIGAELPRIVQADCLACGACADVCKENAISLAENGEINAIDTDRCVHCGACTAICPTGTLESGERGYQVLIGGKLGRHPRLAVALPGIHTADTVIQMMEAFMAFYKARSTHGQRFAQLLTDADIAAFQTKWAG
ncbi:MAG: sulfite reductase [Deltaproteobacteria bacterium]|nr:MAG: sulfite reductase [Deltaproteobacteria bacterium]